jgi:hypothetical protein
MGYKIQSPDLSLVGLSLEQSLQVMPKTQFCIRQLLQRMDHLITSHPVMMTGANHPWVLESL